MLRRLSSLTFMLAVSVWSFQIMVWATTGQWTPVPALYALPWLDLPAPPPGMAGWVLGANLGILAFLMSAVLFYASFPWRALAARLRAAQERRAIGSR